MKEIAVGDYTSLRDDFVRSSYRLSAYSLPSLIVWSNPPCRAYFTRSDGLLIVTQEFIGPEKGRFLLLPLGGAEWPSPEELWRVALTIGCDNYGFVPEDYVETVGREDLERYFVITPQPFFDDYVYGKEDLAVLAGRNYTRKRNLIHQFEERYLSRGRVDMGPITSADVEDCLIFLEHWCSQRSCTDGEKESLLCERLAVVKALRHLESLPWRSLRIRIDGEVVAFAMASILTADMGVLNFEKAFPTVKGLYQFLDRECARRLFGDCTYINKECDMGIPALAVAKKSYRPCVRIKSFHLRRRP